ncbi:MAG: RIP metalloprotease [Rickettsiales bacterium]
MHATPELIEREDKSGNIHRLGVLGVSSIGRDHIRHDPLTAVWRAVLESGYLTAGTLKAIGQVISGERDTKELGGPIKIAQISHDFAQISPDSLVWLIALLSINLGLLNLFPIPMLDGGHLLFYAFEAVMGRPLGERAQEIGLRIGLALVISLMVFVTVNDLINL